MIWADVDEGELPEHERCVFCREWICPGDHPWGCAATAACLKDGNTACPSYWTAYEILVHARCVPAFDKELEDDERHFNAGLQP